MVDQARNLLVQLSAEMCCKCGFTTWMAEEFRQQCKTDKKSFYCTSCGQGQGWFGDNEADKLRKQLERANAETERQRKLREWAEQETRNQELRLRAQKGATTRIKNRVANGVCPCCTRSFGDLKRHMATKHPDYQKDSA